MARFNEANADSYGEKGVGDFFSLKNHGDVAQVRFMYRNMNEVIGVTIHEVQVDGRQTKVECLQNPGDGVGVCPLCDAGIKIQSRIYVPLFNLEVNEVQVWERGKTFMSKLASLCGRYAGAEQQLVSTPFEIERVGVKGDQKTKYETYPLLADGVVLEDLPEVPDVFGGLVKVKTAEDMDYFLSHGSFPDSAVAPTQNRNPQQRQRQTAPAPQRQRQATANQPAPTNPAAGRQRRTPSNPPANNVGFSPVSADADDDDLPF
jgi:hypothetical protein